MLDKSSTVKRLTLFTLLLFSSLWIAAPTRAADADDLLVKSFGSGFGTNGSGTVQLELNNETQNSQAAIAIQDDEKIVVAGSQDSDFWVARFNVDGSKDMNFGIAGERTRDIAGQSSDYAYDVAIQSDGKIVVVGSADDDFAVARFLTNGHPDTSFNGGSGSLTTDFNGDGDIARVVVIQSDGKILVGGGRNDCGITNCNEDFALARYNVNGTLDTTFDGNGLLTTDFGADLAEQVNALQILPDGNDFKILAIGEAHDSGVFPTADNGIVAARYHSDGSLDNTFDGDGEMRSTAFSTFVSSPAGGSHATVQTDGKIVVISDQVAEMVRFHTDGSEDTAYVTDDGLKLMTPAGLIAPRRVDALPDNTILVAGTLDDSNQPILANFLPSRELNPDFGDGSGYVTRDPAVSRATRDVAFSANGSITLLHFGTNGATYLSRYLPDGSLDSGGRTTTNVAPFDEAISDIALMDNGRIVTIGYKHFATKDQVTVGLYSPDGTPFTSFGLNGFRWHLSGGYHTRGVAGFVNSAENNAITVVAAKVNVDGSGRDIALWKMNQLGTTIYLNFIDLGAEETPTAIAQQPDGKFLVAGLWETQNDAPARYFLARFNADGTLDTSFLLGVGYAVTHFGETAGLLSYPRAMTVDQDGNILVVGHTNDNGSLDFAINRHLPTGQLDTTFDENGRLTASLGPYDTASAVAVHSDGDILIGGTGGFGGSRMMLLRFNDDGSADRPEGNFGTAHFDSVPAQANDMALLPNGEIVLAGCRFGTINQRMAMAHFNANGTLKQSFSDDGMATFALSSRFECAQSLMQMPDNGDFILAGFMTAGFDVNGDYDTAFALARVEGAVVTIPTVVQMGDRPMVQNNGLTTIAIATTVGLLLTTFAPLLSNRRKRFDD